MINTFNRKELGVAVACALALGIFAATAEAQAQDEHALVTSSDGSPVMSGFGLCVRSSFGPAPHWTLGCHEYVPTRLVRYVTPAETPAAAAAPFAVAAPFAYETVRFDGEVVTTTRK